MKIETSTLWHGRTGNELSYFHPRATMLEDGELLMTLQEISGSDYFHPTQYALSKDAGHTWSKPEPIPGFGRQDIGEGISEGVCDVVPDFHAQTGTTLALGHNVYYRDGRLFDSLGDFRKEDGGRRLQRFPVYNVRNPQGQWLPERKRLECSEFSDCSIYSSGCSQRVILPDGNILLPITFGIWGVPHRSVTSVLCSFDGIDLRCVQKGSDLTLSIGRGFLEPQLTSFQGRFYMTIRAEDGHGYVAGSDDGLEWSAAQPWEWDSGDAISMSTTQQHWLELKGKLYLLYNRKTENNFNVMRWRSPLFIAECDPEQHRLIRATEQIVFPLVGDGVGAPEQVPLMGNFHPLRLSDEKAIVTVGEMLPGSGYVGDTLIAFLETT